MGDTKGSKKFREYSRVCGPNDIPYCPIRLMPDKDIPRRYVEMKEASSGIDCVGSFGIYGYLDMDVTIAETPKAGRQIAKSLLNCEAPQPFCEKVL